MSHEPRVPVLIIGAGPYGLSIAAHLQAAGIDYRIFGRPMHRWYHQMPKGMFLKSEGHASSLSDPSATYTLAKYCSDNRLPYEETGRPVSLETFTRYAEWFRENLVSTVEEVMATQVECVPGGFLVHFSNDTKIRALRVVIATGLDHMTHTNPALSSLPPELVSHSADHHELSRFKDKDVTVIGGGQSAIETAVLLAEKGASVRLLVRKPSLAWNPLPENGDRPLYRRLRYPKSGLGNGLRAWTYCHSPMLFRWLPRQTRLQTAFSVLGPAGAWWLRERTLGRVPILLSHVVSRAEARGGRALLNVVGPEGQSSDLITDHVISATGYRFDLQRLPFLSRRLKSEVRTLEHQPLLSSACESSVRGLYFTGLASASSLGPAMRFIAGTPYTARSVSHHVGTGHRYGVRPILHFAGTES